MGSILSVDYGMWGVISILIFYFAKPENRFTRTIAAFGVVFIFYAYPLIYNFALEHGIRLFVVPGMMMLHLDLFRMFIMFLFSLIAVLLIFLYNGKQGPKFKWAFYAFYPIHISILAAIWHIGG